MTTRSQYQRNAARRGLHQMSSENEIPDALSFSPLKRLELELSLIHISEPTRPY